ncbi:(2Fe-2S) ferredoxin domain-containing protein [Candidatus Fermentibacteria bacterium]|nr:(2Fe-2S) ferredoxin domain-containing protein [Candidatus Fermentibacteria bacterium]
MPKLKIEDLETIAARRTKAMTVGQGAGRVKITVHLGTCGISAGAQRIKAEVMRLVQDAGISDVTVTSTGCAGYCSREPMITVQVMGQAPVKYVDLDEKKAGLIFDRHVLEGSIVEEYALGIGSEHTA